MIFMLKYKYMKELSNGLLLWHSTGDRYMEGAQAVRRQVFVEDQNVLPRNEFDLLDIAAEHYTFFLPDMSTAIATVRVRSEEENSVAIERLAVLYEYRHHGYGRSLLKLAEGDLRIKEVDLARIEAPFYTRGFFEKLGFTGIGGPYEVTGDKVKMLKMFSYDED